jgi:peptidoglycan-associated lipoprotein
MSRLTALLLVVGLPLFSVACKKPAPPPPPPRDAAPLPPPPPPPPPVVETLKENLRRVNFEFDRATLTSGSEQPLRENAALMQKYGSIIIEVQGHADERGSTGYNLALGERRANAVVKKLTAMGVPASQLRKVSYGEERPLQTGDGESIWAANRRAEFRLTNPDGSAIEGTTSR